MKDCVGEEHAITDAWNAFAYAPETSAMPPEEKARRLHELAARVATLWHAVAQLPTPEGCADVRDQYALALRKHHQIYLLTKSYAQTRDECYRTLANQERQEATSLRREVWGMLGDLEYWLEQHPCPGPGAPSPPFEGAASV